MSLQSINPDHHFDVLKRLTHYHNVRLSITVAAIFMMVAGGLMLVTSYFILPHAMTSLTILTWGIVINSGWLLYTKNIWLLSLQNTLLGIMLARSAWILANRGQQTILDELFASVLIPSIFTVIFLIVFLKLWYDYWKHCRLSPDPILYAWLQAEADYLRDNQSRNHERVMNFSIRSGSSRSINTRHHYVPWHARLYPQCVILVSGALIKILRREELVIYDDIAHLLQKKISGFMTILMIEGRKKTIVIDRASVERYVAWSTTPAPSGEAWYVPWA